MMNNINLQIDAAARQVSQNGKAVYLTQTEFDLLLYLLDNAGRITTRSELLAQVWGITAPSTPERLICTSPSCATSSARRSRSPPSCARGM